MIILRITNAMASLFLFVVLFNEATNKPDGKARNGRIISELKDALDGTSTHFEVLYWILLGAAGGNHEEHEVV